MNILESGFRDGTLDMFYVKMWQWTGSNMTLPTCLRGNMQNSCLKYLNSWETVSKLRKKECSKRISFKVFTFFDITLKPVSNIQQTFLQQLDWIYTDHKVYSTSPGKGNFQTYCSEMKIYESLGRRETMKVKNQCSNPCYYKEWQNPWSNFFIIHRASLPRAVKRVLADYQVMIVFVFSF